MKREYKLSIVVRGNFDRKINARAWAKRIAESLELPEPWELAGTKVSSKAKREITPKAPDPMKAWLETRREQTLEKLRVMADVMARILGNVRKPRLRRWPHSKCGPQFNDTLGNGCHTHTTNGTLYFKGKPIGNLYGMICINDKWLDALAETGHGPMLGRRSFRSYDMVHLIAHEVAHIRKPGGSHNRRSFEETAEKLEADYRAWERGELKLTERSLPWTRPVDMGPPTSPSPPMESLVESMSVTPAGGSS